MSAPKLNSLLSFTFHVCVCRSVVSNSVTPGTVTHQAPLSMKFSRQEYWSGLPFPPPGDLLGPGFDLASPGLAGRFFTLSHLGSPFVRSESEVTQLCPALCNLMDCSPQGSSVHEILRTRILEWIAISFSGRSSQPRDRTWVSCIVGGCFTR